MKEEDRNFFENVVFTCMILLSGLITVIGLAQLVKMAL